MKVCASFYLAAETRARCLLRSPSSRSAGQTSLNTYNTHLRPIYNSLWTHPTEYFDHEFNCEEFRTYERKTIVEQGFEASAGLRSGEAYASRVSTRPRQGLGESSLCCQRSVMKRGLLQSVYKTRWRVDRGTMGGRGKGEHLPKGNSNLESMRRECPVGSLVPTTTPSIIRSSPSRDTHSPSPSWKKTALLTHPKRPLNAIYPDPFTSLGSAPRRLVI